MEEIPKMFWWDKEQNSSKNLMETSTMYKLQIFSIHLPARLQQWFNHLH